MSVELTPELEAMIDRGAKLQREIKALEKKQEELNALKAELRELANGKDLSLETESGSAVTVEQKDDAPARVVPNESLPKVLRLAGDKLLQLFTLHPSKGNAKSFELNAHQLLPKKSAIAIIDEITVPATAWVKFSS